MIKLYEFNTYGNNINRFRIEIFDGKFSGKYITFDNFEDLDSSSHSIFPKIGLSADDLSDLFTLIGEYNDLKHVLKSIKNTHPEYFI